MHHGRSYVTRDEIKPYAWQYDDADLTIFDSLGVRASRIFDIMCYVPAEYFFKQSENAEARVFYGTGSVFLVLPQHYEPVVTVTMPTGYKVPQWVEIDGCLRTKNDSGIIFQPLDYCRTFWAEGVPVTVTAKWGFEFVPEDVKEAVAELVIAMWRSKDTAFLKAVSLDTNSVIVKESPERTKMVAAFYSGRKSIPAFV
jgi:hypothetical protein